METIASNVSENIQSVILAAGTASRLHPLTKDLPKCLLEIHGKTILQRLLEHVFSAGVRRIAVVIGFQGDLIRQHLHTVFPGHRFRYILNPHYQTTNNAYSLLLSKKFMENTEEAITNSLLMLDSDLLFDQTLLTDFLQHPADDKIAVRIQGCHDEEEIGVTIDANENIVMIGKQIADAVGESVGIELFSPASAAKLYQVLEQRVKSGEGRTEFYEASFQQLIMRGLNLAMVKVDPHPIIEIDTPADYQQALQLTLN